MEKRYIINLEKNKKITYNFVDIRILNWKKVKKDKLLTFNIDLGLLADKREMKKVVRKILKLKRNAEKRKIKIGIKCTKNDNSYVVANIENYDISNKKHQDFVYSVYAILKENKKERYNYIYDIVCDELDSYFYGKNFCDFKNNKCGEKRETSSTIGCCRHYKNKLLGPLLFNNFTRCEYLNLKDKKCKIKCISCKLFTCDYLKSKGIQFKIKDIFLLDTFFNPLQKYIIKISVYTPKDKIIKRLLFFSANKY